MRTNQKTKVYNYMRTHGEISQREAIFLGVYRLSAVIFELKKELKPIKTELRVVTTSDGAKTAVAFYSLASEEDLNHEI